MPQRASIYVDHTHCGRHVTGLERITLELFSREALSPLTIVPLTARHRLAMMARQMLQMPLLAAMEPGSILVCPGFPPSYLATLFGSRVLPYIHDLFLITRPQDLNVRAKLLLRGPFQFAVRRLPRFLVNSQATADELRRFCRIDAQIMLYRPSVRDVFGLGNASPKDRGRATPLRLVALGTIEPRKNLGAATAILSALRQQGHHDATLDIVGRPGWGVDATDLASVPGVTLHGYQPIERVRDLLVQADALISTSHDEGLGLPLLEAQYGGLCVIAPDQPVFREVLGQSGLLINPHDIQAAAQAIGMMMAQRLWRQNAYAAAHQNISRWNQQAVQDHQHVIALLLQLSTLSTLSRLAGPQC